MRLATMDVFTDRVKYTSYRDVNVMVEHAEYSDNNDLLGFYCT